MTSAAKWLVCRTPGRVVRIQALSGALRCVLWQDAALCSWARYFTPIVLLSNQVYKWVLAKFMLGVTSQWTCVPSEVVLR